MENLRSQNDWVFEFEPMADKKLTCIPGIGVELRKKFEKAGILTAEQLLGHWLLADGDFIKFKSWMANLLGLPMSKIAFSASRIHDSLAEWTSRFVF